MDRPEKSIFVSPAAPLETLLDAVQRRTFLYFWDGAHPTSGLPYDKCFLDGTPGIDAISISGTGFGVMAIIVAAHRGWVSRRDALSRIETIVDSLERAPRYHGTFSHFVHPVTSEMIPFSALDDGGDLVETTLLMQGLLCAREYFSGETMEEKALGTTITRLFDEIEWSWFVRGEHSALYWHWSPVNGWAMNLPIVGWNEALSTYVLGAGSKSFAIPTASYHTGWARRGGMENGETYLGTVLPLGEPFGGPLFLSQYSFCALDPRGLTDQYADYHQQAIAHSRINRDYCLTIPEYEDAGVWGLTACETPTGYDACSPTNDHATIAPTAALSSFPFLPKDAEGALRAMLAYGGGRLFENRYGFPDGFSPKADWIASRYLAIDQGPIVAMIENHRSGLLWDLFMAAPEVKRGLDALEIRSARYEA